MEQLKKCPFCGGEAEINLLLSNYCVTCTECMGSIFPAKGMTKAEAITAWNTRKPIEMIVENLEEAMERQWDYYYQAKSKGNIRQMDYSDGCAEGLTTAIEIVKEELSQETP